MNPIDLLNLELARNHPGYFVHFAPDGNSLVLTCGGNTVKTYPIGTTGQAILNEVAAGATAPAPPPSPSAEPIAWMNSMPMPPASGARSVAPASSASWMDSMPMPPAHGVKSQGMPVCADTNGGVGVVIDGGSQPSLGQTFLSAAAAGGGAALGGTIMQAVGKGIVNGVAGAFGGHSSD